MGRVNFRDAVDKSPLPLRERDRVRGPRRGIGKNGGAASLL